MYAMDRTSHFEHRAEPRRPRWTSRVSHALTAGRSTPSGRPQPSTPAAVEPSRWQRDDFAD
jgi:hypothetical protein